MKVRWIQPEQSVGAKRGETVVCIPVHGGHEHFVGALHSVLAHTAADIRILIYDDASPDSRSEEYVRQLERTSSGPHEILYVRRAQNVGFPANVNGAFTAAAPADVVILNSDCLVAEGWLEGLREAAYSDSRVATATALTNHGSLVSVPERKPTGRLPDDWSLDSAAAAVRERSQRIRPRLLTAIGHCALIRRSALELVGDFDLAFTPGYGEEVDFSQRCLHRGLSHVLADDVLVLHHGGGSFSLNGQTSPIQKAHEQIISARYPYYHDSVRVLEDDASSPLARARGVARRALKGLSLGIDARILTGPTTGSQLHTLELIAALARTGSARVTAIVPDDLSSAAASALETLPEIRLLTRDDTGPLTQDRLDVVHRPFQINNDEDLVFLARLGERLVITNQDLIGFHNPSYFRSSDAWQGYRRITRSALAVADRVVFFSAHAFADALAEDLIEPSRASVVHIGVDHTFTGSQQPLPPCGSERLPANAEAILCIGTDFRHKNRVFALRVLEQLQRRHDWSGYLLLAGPRVAQGSSVPDETELLAARPDVARAVLDFKAVSEAEKAWLYERAHLVLYPTVHEGFGLVPFEAADYGVPCMWAKGTSLSELLPDATAGIVPWDVESTAVRALELLRDDAARERNLESTQAAAQRLTWDVAAAQLIDLYNATCDAAASVSGALDRTDGLMRGLLSEDAIRLIGPGGALPREMERPLLALATHPQISAPMFRAIKLGYQASYRLRRRGRKNAGAVNGAGEAPLDAEQ